MKAWIGVVWVAACASWGVGFSWAQGSAREKRRELREVQQQLELKRQEIGDLKRQSQEMRKDLSRLALSAAESQKRVRRLEQRIREAMARRAELRARLGGLQLAQGHWQGLLGAEIKGYYLHTAQRSDRYGWRGLWEEELRRGAIVGKARTIRGLHGVRRKAEVQQAEITRQKADLQAKTQKALEEHKTQQTLYRQKEDVYRQAQSRVTQTLHSISELQNSALALTQLVRSLERKVPYKTGGPVPLAQPPHSLPWPVEGKVVSTFGKQRVAGLHTWVIRQGIRISTAREASVRPVKAGKVIFSGSFRSYGEVVIVDHGQAFYSIYGALGSRHRKVGDPVGPSQTVGIAGPGEGSSDGAVYFEIRQSGDALDPIQWLR